METKEKYDVKKVTWPEKHFLVKREVVKYDDLPKFFKNTYDQLFYALEEQNVQPESATGFAFYYSINEDKKETDVAAAVAVPANTEATENLKMITLPPSELLTTTYIGPMEGIGAPYSALEKYLKENGLERELYIEEYFSDPAIEKDPSKYKTVIYYLIK